MIKSLNTGTSALNSFSNAMGTIGDNIANVKTNAFKSNNVTFANLLSQITEGSRAGDGVRIWDTATSWAQGAPENTGNPTDLSINGNGFFIVKDPAGTIFYTRAGQFSIDKDGELVNPDGFTVQGREVQVDGATGEQVLLDVGDIVISSAPIAPQQTANLSMRLNLNADAAAETTDGNGDPVASNDEYKTSLTVYDSVGSAVVLYFTFRPQGVVDDNATWIYEVRTDPAATAPTIAFGNLIFDNQGNLDDTVNRTIDITVPANPNNGAAEFTAAWQLFDGNDPLITGYSLESTTVRTDQDGFPTGSLQRVAVDEEGVISGIYSNGEVTPLYRLTLATFSNYQGLTGQGDTLYSESIQSGPATTGEAATGPFGLITPGALEMSNVDLSSEFVNMITTQRAFQANAKVITTSDEILTELVNLKR